MELSNSNEAGEEISVQLQKMKQRLRRKEKRLNKFNKVLSSRKHVRETILREKLENVENDNVLKIEPPLNVSSCNKTELTSEKKNANRSVKFCVSENGDVTKEFLKEQPYDSPKFSRSVISSNKNGSTNIVSSYNSINDLNCKSVRSKSSFKSPESKGHENVDNIQPTQLVNEASISSKINIKRNSFKRKAHVKNLFNNTNVNNHFISTAEKSKVSPILLNSLDGENEHKVNHDESRMRNLNVVLETNSKEMTVGCEEPTKSTHHMTGSETEASHDESGKKDGGKGNEFVSVTSLRERHLGDIVGASISCPLDGLPTILIVYAKGFSVWNLVKDAKGPKNGSNSIWTQSFDKHVDLFEGSGISNLCLFGGGAKQETNFFIIHRSSSECGFLRMVLIQQQSLGKEVKVLSQVIPLNGCVNCSCIGCGLQSWNFFLYIEPCRNASCANNNLVGVLFNLSFDIVYSWRRKEWDLVVDVVKRVEVGEQALASMSVMWHYEASKCCVRDEEFILWQDARGGLGVVSPGTSFCFAKPEAAIGDLLSSGRILYAANVKSVVVLLVVTKESFQFAALNPLTGQGEVFYQAPHLTRRSEVDQREPSTPPWSSVALLDEGFALLSADATLLTLRLA